MNDCRYLTCHTGIVVPVSRDSQLGFLATPVPSEGDVFHSALSLPSDMAVPTTSNFDPIFSSWLFG